MTQDKLNILDEVLKKAAASGATSADAVLIDSSSVSAAQRLGKTESIVRAEEAEIGLRVFIGKQQAIVSSSDTRGETLQDMADRAVAMAKLAPEDIYAGIADASDFAKNIRDLDLYDDTSPDIEAMTDLTARAEAAALETKGITNSDGAEFSVETEKSFYATSNGFRHVYQSSGFSLSVSVIAGKGDAMETDYDYDSVCFLSDLTPPEEIGKKAAMRAVKALNPKKGTTKKLPVVFDNRVSGGLLGSLAAAISGAAVARGTTMLKDKMNQKIFADGIIIVDDPFMKRGHRSRPFDGEGLPPQKRNIIDDGVLTGWFLDLASARQLGLTSTGSAMRGASSPPSPRPANFYMQPGEKTPEELISEIEEGFFVTQLMGSGGNIVTGDYSCGASGFWIKNGKIAYPVSEMTVAGNLKDMWLNLAPANDLAFRRGIDAPSIRVDGLMVAGG